LAIFAGLVMYDFQRLCMRTQIDSAPTLAASIFLDILNIFQSFLTLFGRTRLLTVRPIHGPGLRPAIPSRRLL